LSALGSTDNKKEEVVAMRRLMFMVFIFFLLASFAFAGSTTYQVTGPVLEVKDNSITVQKGKEKWEIARDKDTKVTGDLKVGSKVTVYYTMKATSVEVKGDEKKKEEKKKK
jgi:hypothetical protein